MKPDEEHWEYLSSLFAYNVDGTQRLCVYETDSWMRLNAQKGWSSLALFNNSSQTALVFEWQDESKAVAGNYVGLDGKVARAWLICDWTQSSLEERKDSVAKFLKGNVEGKCEGGHPGSVENP
jgi:hypothetical protein